MKIVASNETNNFECRVAITPEVSKKLVDWGHEVFIENGSGTAAGMIDSAYEAAGATIAKDTKSLYKDADIVLRVSPPTLAEISALPKECILVGMLKPHGNESLSKEIAKRNITAFALELIPRISRAQSMDVLSSQSNLAGYKAVVDAASEFGRAMPMMMTAAGMIPPARALILGAGVAGLQAIATARRLGAIVSAFDVRPAVKEQVESLGATFLEVESFESGEGTGGYAKEMSADYKKRQQEKLEEVMRQQDIVITTAQIPGKPAPILITEKMVKEMKAGSVIVDLAIESGGNCEAAVLGKVVVKHGVKILGYPNFPSRIPNDASQVYARNVFNFLKLLLNKEGKKLAIDWNDEIITGAVFRPREERAEPAPKRVRKLAKEA
ncbi:MAG: Re/Si-specific NAD(P)(+) transhydrogenase subunit alpha [Alphaproteobacteria bacterium]|jgi:NAD(P) transhydrogenase subunit alpha|nr:Re/Si-specific NAD(P)(+) transhydrogenase subunit alpha [Alphaproteobacteria bacterium]